METAPMDLDRSDLKNLASFFARRFPSPSERAQLSGAAGLGWTETAGLEPVAAWTELITLARQRKSMPVLAWAAVEARKQDTNLAEVCQVLGARAPEAGPHFGRSTVRNAVAAAFLVGLSLVGFGVLERQRAAPDAPSDAERFAALEEAASLGEATAPVGGLVSVAVPAAGAAAPRPWAEGSPLDKNSGAGLTPVAPVPTVAPTVAPTAAPTTATAAGSGFVAVSPAAAAPVATPVAASPAKAAPVAAAAAKVAPVVVAPAKAASVVAAPAKAAPVVAPVAKAAPVAAAPAKAAPVPPAPAVAKVSSPPAATPSSASFPITAPVGEPDGRCKVKGGGLVGWWYAGAEKPGRAGEVIRVTRSANVRATRPDPSNGWNFQSTMRCSVMAGDRLRISGEPVLVNGEAWWVPLQSGDLNPS